HQYPPLWRPILVAEPPNSSPIGAREQSYPTRDGHTGYLNSPMLLSLVFPVRTKNGESRGSSALNGRRLSVCRLALLSEELLEVVRPAGRLVRRRARLPAAEGLHADDGARRRTGG